MLSQKIVFLLFLIAYSGGLAWAKPDDLGDSRAAFLHDQISREAYLDRLVAIRYEYVWNGGNKGNPILDGKISAIDDELKKHLLPPNSDSRLLARLRTGKWESPRHSYFYRADHTWRLLPIEERGPYGLWRIEGNRYYDWAPSFSSRKPTYLIILLNDKYFVFTDGKRVFYEIRVNRATGLPR